MKIIVRICFIKRDYHARTPIIEETESTVERELLSRDQSRRFRMSDSVQVSRVSG